MFFRFPGGLLVSYERGETLARQYRVELRAKGRVQDVARSCPNLFPAGIARRRRIRWYL